MLAAVERFMCADEIPSSVANAVVVSLDEILSNIVKYTPPSESALMEMTLSAVPGLRELRLTVEDDGPPFDPTVLPDPDTSGSISSRQIGGLGIFIVKHLMDKIEYNREHGRNQLVMVKSWPLDLE